jgi:hypothetical protein
MGKPNEEWLRIKALGTLLVKAGNKKQENSITA